MSGQSGHEVELIRRIGELVTEERDLREQRGHRLTPAERDRIRELETTLDQCWDLLRQRRAREEFGGDPDEAHPRPRDQVEGYRQ
ncbi:DUF2630 family protein [Thermobifida cellulosilytica]|jgi:hypothetical protein|uniref:DUF2630 domain-containing protein n=1 Tax=Thermobifida cellulosilytica TB100 TaxID=665004 RepID=A0A147KFJ7_THECS|nr:DUF2630 family protein [Thermobifida cellulosilytica]KUP96062.1 hypothetical protein AC529_14195 [Thermobifida cellulosilytica TB100]